MEMDLFNENERYVIGHEIAIGSSSKVYSCIALTSMEDYAIKIKRKDKAPIEVDLLKLLNQEKI
jgi:RIO-like serine/threonine protein kinase